MNQLSISALYAAIPAPVKGTFDVAAILGWVTILSGVFTTVLGLVAAIFSCAWAAIRFFETETVQKWLGRRRSSR